MNPSKTQWGELGQKQHLRGPDFDVIFLGTTRSDRREISGALTTDQGAWDNLDENKKRRVAIEFWYLEKVPLGPSNTVPRVVYHIDHVGFESGLVTAGSGSNLLDPFPP